MSHFPKNCPSLRTTAKPGCLDVLCGRGRGFFEYSGNRRMLSIVARFKQEYQMASKIKKSSITQKVFELVMNPEEGGQPRFLKKMNATSKTSDASWCELDEKEILKKISHTLREQKDIVKLPGLVYSDSLKDGAFESSVPSPMVVDEIRSSTTASDNSGPSLDSTLQRSSDHIGRLQETPSYRDSILSIDLDLFSLDDDKHCNESFLQGLEFGRSSSNTISDDETSSPSDSDEYTCSQGHGSENGYGRNYARVFDESQFCLEQEPFDFSTEMDTFLRDVLITEGSVLNEDVNL